MFELYFRFRFLPVRSYRDVILYPPAKFYSNPTIGDGVMTLSRTSVGMTPATVFFFLFGAVPDVGTVMPSRHVQQSDGNMIDRWTSAGQLAH